MCGIAGILHLDLKRAVERDRLERITQALAHRGPDAAGFHIDGPIGLGHRRLSIIDLEGGRQPIANEDKSLWVVCNGEIYNYIELRQLLQSKGHRFSTQSDTEVILHQYEEEGVHCVDSFRGMFAFALWDETAKRLLLARDRVGKKPLWYTTDGRRLLFASELQALLADPEVDRALDPQALHLYLTYGYVPSPKSILAGIRKLPPAHRLVWEKGNLTLQRYWELSFEPKSDLPQPEAQERFIDLFEEAVRIRLRSDVPVGAFLSGGLDSSSVVAMMARLSSRPVKTFSIGFEELQSSELAYARQVAKAFSTEHHEFIVRPEATSVLPLLVRHYGDPYADSSCIPTFYVARETRRHVTVALNGDGGDESFAGYPRYLGAALSVPMDRLPRPAKRIFQRILSRVPGQGGGRASRFFQALADTPTLEGRYLRWIGYFMPEELERLYALGFLHHLNGSRPEEFLFGLYRRHPIPSVIERLMAVDLESYLPEDLLVKMDIASMIHALEMRSPFLDHRLMEYMAHLPVGYKIKGFTSKVLLRKAMAGILPPAILTRSKMGFGIPLGRWLKGELNGWMRQILLDPRALNRGIFRPEGVRALMEEHTLGVRDHRYRLWALIVLELWHQAFLDSR